MVITDVEAIPVEIGLKPLEEDHGLAPYIMGRLEYLESARRVIVKLTTSEGITGWGETAVVHSPSITKSIIETVVADIVVGEPVWKFETLHEYYGSHYIDSSVFLSGVEMAMWDAFGKHNDCPLHQLLGGKQTNRVDFSYCYAINTIEKSTERMRDVRDAGFDVVKTKVGGYGADTAPDDFAYERSIDSDVERLIAMYDAVDGEVELRADANQSWTVSDTTRIAARLEDAGVYLGYIEQPIRTDNVGSYKRLRQRLRTPIAVNEDLYHPGNFYELVREDAIDVGVIDMIPVGGIVPMKKMASLAEEADVSLAHHCGFDLGVKTAAMLHAISTTPAIDLHSDTTYYALEDHIIEDPFEFEDGSLSVPSAPGLGVTIDEEKLDTIRTDE
ncbi:mandelate racemase/muconate lactonizing enzyme family protein [Natrarchaeobius halalkaliphilus]|uniref:Mandelate racemase/muconate lactonizing enzyme family protein n=1 Tax=Natrarchaeobius halalkaliphilus TaxID=1679091 RepID=A0A3N6NU49_9EURY|nr:mandelate racemase/muconate lactonizing enzyme family protein [Natrarchaeobius halalkaliphilus]RQG86650.1 mandelate racemase/muconate lactonizing enzyme family protein [Natrarchaeobius halalkaliphilus]